MTEGDNLPAERIQRVTQLEMPIAKDPDTGEMVRRMYAKLPSLMMEMEAGYPRGTHLKLEVEVRVRRAFTDEFTAGPHKGELFREHHFSIVEATIIGAYSADDLDPGVGGSLAGSSQQEQEMDDRPELEEEEDDHEPGATDGGDGDATDAQADVPGKPGREQQQQHDPGF